LTEVVTLTALHSPSGNLLGRTVWVALTTVLKRSLVSYSYVEFRCVPDVRVLTLTLTADEGRILVTHDRSTMPAEFARFIATRTCPGVIIVSRKLGIATTAEWLHLLWEASEAKEYLNSLYSLP
jgi:hypothetical protein